MTRRVVLRDVLRQYRITHWIKDDETYRQVTISQAGEVSFRGEKKGKDIGRKRQFIVDLDKHPNTLIFIRQGVFKGGIGLAPKEINKCVVTENMPMFDIVSIKPGYLSYYLKSPYFKNNVSKLVPLGTAQKAIHEKRLLQLEIPLPTEEVQDEVVSRIDRILEKKASFSSNANRNINLVLDLRNAILKEAISGKLIPHDPNDEPALELLRKIKAKKEDLVREGKIKKEKDLPLVVEGEIPFELPEGWKWIRMGDLLASFDYGTSKKSFETAEGIPVLSMGNVVNGNLNFLKLKKTSKENQDLPRLLLRNGDILFNRTNSLELVGKTGIYEGENDQFTFASYLIRIRIFNYTCPKYLNYYLMSPTFRKTQIDPQVVKQCGQANFNGTKLKRTLVPLPPLREQRRVVEKIDELMKLCDELDRKARENRDTSEILMEAILREAFEQDFADPNNHGN